MHFNWSNFGHVTNGRYLSAYATAYYIIGKDILLVLNIRIVVGRKSAFIISSYL